MLQRSRPLEGILVLLGRGGCQPISWNIAKEEWISEQMDEEIIFQTKNNEYFYTQDLENLISQN